MANDQVKARDEQEQKPQLSSYEPVRVMETPVQVTDEMIEAQLARELARFASFEDAPGAAKEGEVLRVDMTVTVNGQVEPSLTGKDMSVLLSREMEPAGFVEGVTGMLPGEQRSFSFEAADSQNPSAVPDSFQVQVYLKEKRRRTVPQLTDEFVRERLSQSCRTVGEFREQVRAYLAEQQRRERDARREQLATAELGKRLVGVIPDEQIEEARDGIVESLMADLTASGMTLAQFMQQQGMTERQFQMTVTMQARESIRQGRALDALSEHLGVLVDDAARARALAELAPGNEDEARQRCDEQDGWDIVDTMARRMAARDWLMETAVFC